MIETPPNEIDTLEVPGVVVDRRPPEVRAHISGTGLEVWEVMKTWFEVNEDWPTFRDCYEDVPEDDLRAALEYGRKHWDIIEARIALDYTYVPESFRDDIPERWR